MKISLAASLVFGLAAASALAAPPSTATFEGGAPAGFFVFNGGASSVSTAVQVVPEGTPLARPGQVGANGVLAASFTVGDFGGFGVDFSAPGSTGPQDWSGTDGFAFWFHGAASGLVYQRRSSTTARTRPSTPPSGSTSTSRTTRAGGATCASPSRPSSARPTSSRRARPTTA